MLYAIVAIIFICIMTKVAKIIFIYWGPVYDLWDDVSSFLIELFCLELYIHSDLDR